MRLCVCICKTWFSHDEAHIYFLLLIMSTIKRIKKANGVIALRGHKLEFHDNSVLKIKLCYCEVFSIGFKAR